MVYISGDGRVSYCEKTSSYEHVSNSSYQNIAVRIYKHESIVNDDNA
jgi:hypothetical protein